MNASPLPKVGNSGHKPGVGKKNGNDPLVSVGCFLISFTLNILREVGALPQEAARYTPPRFYSDSLASGPVAATSLYV